MSWILTAARSCADAVIAILNLRGRNENSGCSVVYWRSSSDQMRGIVDLAGATPAHWSDVTLRVLLPEVCMAWMPTSARSASDIGQLGELDPVVLNVLPRGEMAVAAVVACARHARSGAVASMDSVP